MSVRSTNSSGPGLANRSAPQDKPAATPAKPATPNVVDRALARLPKDVDSHFERSGESTRTFSKTGGTERDMFTPKLGDKGAAGLLGTALRNLPAITKEGSFAKSASVFSAEGSVSDPSGRASASGRVAVLEADVSGSGSVGLEGGALKARGEVKAEATLVEAEGRAQADLGILKAEAEGRGYIGVQAKANGELTIDPLNGVYKAQVGGEAFAGAKVGGRAAVSLGEFGGAGVKAEAWAGVGVSGRAEVSLEKGRFKARFELGAALGVGFKIGFDVDINFGKIADAVKNVISKPVEVIKDIGKSVGNFFKKLF
ncbi:hypothetical protein SAMN05444354_1206 [Stigmatella aurantiaca]|uniref:Uncharacterized protein n=1 Tax=Stigmatella aurantiaca TaxID=41 RepID=A0A1H7ZY26_STIAU|nr:hypothetical protein [Stigmatella aurantiaca]SEM63221.1 hypothetical protein SAMN05444354_1206 [Stigmatella aurantiaca]